jgi:cell division protein FtsQ
LLPKGTPMTFSAASGLGWKDTGGWEVYIGTDLDQYDQKIALYQSISTQLAGQGITPALISVEFLNAPYYRLEK